MRCSAGVLLLVLLLSLSSLSSSAAEPYMKSSSGNAAATLAGRRRLRGREAMADAVHGGVGKKKDEVVAEGKGPKNTGANTAPAHGGDKTVEVTVVGLGGGGESAGRKSGGKRKFAGQVPLNCDYRPPRLHPPTHN